MPSHKTSIQPILDVNVEYSINPGSRGHCDKYGAPEEPDEPSSIEIEHVYLIAGEDKNQRQVIDIITFLDESEIEDLTADIESELSDEADDYDYPDTDR